MYWITSSLDVFNVCPFDVETCHVVWGLAPDQTSLIYNENDLSVKLFVEQPYNTVCLCAASVI